MRDLPSDVFDIEFPDAEGEHFRSQTWTRSDLAPEALGETLYPTILHAFMHAGRKGATAGITMLPEKEGEPEEFRTYEDLVESAKRFAGRLASKGLQKGDRALIVLPTSFEYVITFFAVQLVGAIPVPAYPPAMLEKSESVVERLRHIASHADASLVVTTRMLRTLIGDVALRVKSVREIVSIERLASEGPRVDFEARARGEAPAFIQYTSGSTDNPKGVVLSHQNLVSNVHAIGRALHINHEDVVVSWLPLYHDMGLIGALLFSIYWQCPFVLMSPLAFLMKPMRWLDAMSRYKGTLAAAPNFAYARCVKRATQEELQKLDLSSWRFALNGAEPVNTATVSEFQRVFGPVGFNATTMLPVYGLAESSVAVSFTPMGEGVRSELVDRDALADGVALVTENVKNGIPIVSVGRPIPGHEVRVVDELGHTLPERSIGEIICRGPSVMQGYLQDEKKTAEVLKDGWLFTGDVGYVADDRLYVTGRAKDLIIIRGKNFYPEDIELRAERVADIRRGCTVAFAVYDQDAATDRVVLVVESTVTEEEREALETSIREEVQQGCGIAIDELVITLPGTVPKTSSGKRQRSLAKKRYLEGNLLQKKTKGLRLAMLVAKSGLGIASAAARRVFGNDGRSTSPAAQANAAARVNPGQGTSGFIVGRGYDTLFFTASLAVPLLLWAGFEGGLLTGILVYVLFQLLFNLPHNFQTWTLTLLDSRDRERHGKRYLVAAATILFVLGGSMLASPTGVYPLVRDALTYWGYYHLVRQHYGFLRLYERKIGGVSKAESFWYARFVDAVCYLPLLIRFRDPKLMTVLVGDVSVHIGHPVVPESVWVPIALVYGLAIAAMVAHHLVMNAQGRGALAPRAMLLGSITVGFGLAVLAIDSLVVAIAVVTAYHNLQYLGLTWFHNQNRAAEEAKLGSHVRDQSATPVSLNVAIQWLASKRLALYLLVTFGYGVAIFVPKVLFASNLLAELPISFVVALHYYVDSRVWKFDVYPERGRFLKLSSTKNMPAGAPSRAIQSAPAVLYQEA